MVFEFLNATSEVYYQNANERTLQAAILETPQAMTCAVICCLPSPLSTPPRGAATLRRGRLFLLLHPQKWLLNKWRTLLQRDRDN